MQNMHNTYFFVLHIAFIDFFKTIYVLLFSSKWYVMFVIFIKMRIIIKIICI
jgi:hypothetical protein